MLEEEVVRAGENHCSSYKIRLPVSLHSNWIENIYCQNSRQVVMWAQELPWDAARWQKSAGPDGVLDDSPIFQLQAPTNTTSGCINYWLTLEAKKELGKFREMGKIIINNNSSSSSCFFPCLCS